MFSYLISFQKIFVCIKALQWERIHEYLKKDISLDVQPTGICLTNSGLLGASTDGLVRDESIVVVKCPHAFRNEPLSQKLKSNYISYKEGEEISINTNHNYYHQTQGNLHILKQLNCYLCIWTPIEVFTIIVKYDSIWGENLSLLQHFYIKKYLKNLL